MLSASSATRPACLHKHSPAFSAAHSPFFRAGRLVHKRSALDSTQHRCTGLGNLSLTRCQQSDRKAVKRAARSADLQVVAEEEQMPAWKRLAGFLAKTTAVAALAFALTFGSVLPADAARSGGRMGGSSFGAARSGGSSIGSSFGGGSGGSKSYGGGGLGAGSYSAPRLGTGYSSFFGPPLVGGYGYGYGGFGGGPVVQQSSGGGSLITIVLLVVGFLVVAQVASSFLNGGGDDAGSGRSTVAKLQVGLLGSARELQKDLERIAGRADTNTPDGLHYVLQETVLSLLRNPDYCVYGDGDTKNPRGLDGAEEAFNEVVMEERGKFKEETLVNVGGRSKRSSLKSRSSNGMSELIVVTIVVAAEGGVRVPKVSSRDELKAALNKLGSLRSDQILAVEVMWTPQDDDDFYTRDELFLDYPTLNTL